MTAARTWRRRGPRVEAIRFDATDPKTYDHVSTLEGGVHILNAKYGNMTGDLPKQIETGDWIVRDFGSMTQTVMKDAIFQRTYEPDIDSDDEARTRAIVMMVIEELGVPRFR